MTVSTQSRPITESMVMDYLATFADFRRPAEQGYLATAVDRFTHTLNLIPGLPDPESVRVLEIGGRPYFMSVLLQHFFGYDVSVANEPTVFPGEDGDYVEKVNDAGVRHRIASARLNIEYDGWPWPDDFFDIVVYCEVIEHLVYDPTHTLVECHRVLKNDTGTLLLSTPNATAYTGLLDLARGRNIYPPYSGHSYYARHHRLFSLAELTDLCTQIGFEVSAGYSAYDESYWHPARLDRVVRWLTRHGRLVSRLDVIYLLATPHGQPRYAYPSEGMRPIYQDVHAYNRIESGVLRMSDQLPQLGSGFYPFEDWGGGVRWTAPRATLFLKRREETTLSLTFFTGPRSAGEKVRGVVTLELGDAVQRHEYAVAPDSWETLLLPVPDAGEGRLLVDLEVTNPLVPHKVDPAQADTRRLGVALREAALG